MGAGEGATDRRPNRGLKTEVMMLKAQIPVLEAETKNRARGKSAANASFIHRLKAALRRAKLPMASNGRRGGPAGPDGRSHIPRVLKFTVSLSGKPPFHFPRIPRLSLKSGRA